MLDVDGGGRDSDGEDSALSVDDDHHVIKVYMGVLDEKIDLGRASALEEDFAKALKALMLTRKR